MKIYRPKQFVSTLVTIGFVLGAWFSYEFTAPVYVEVYKQVEKKDCPRQKTEADFYHCAAEETMDEIVWYEENCNQQGEPVNAR